MSKQAKQRKQKGRQLGGLDASVVVGEATDTTKLDGDQLLLLAAVSYRSSFLQIVSVKQNHKLVQENYTNKRSSKSCGAEIKLTHKLELMKILRINPNIDSSSGLIKDEDKEPACS